MGKRWAVLCALLLAACTVPTPRPEAPHASPRAPQTMPTPGSFRIDPARSELRLLVYRAGPLASFGHNHVMVNHDLTGTIRVASSIEASSFNLSIPVADFIVDDAKNRGEEGADFPGEISDSAREGTLHNMLSAPLLNGAAYPTIEVRAEQLQETNGSLNATVAIKIAGHETSIEVPFVFDATQRSLVVTASFEIRQTEIGLTPLSLLGGALQVRDALNVKMTLVAGAQAP
ncbi:MAG TPA: YceI family protein [Steroidobacteraceae bacterium]|jgi:hypothetical protein